jgi:hypothetical protein
LKPVLSELATTGFQLTDALWARVAMLQEDAVDVLAEAQQRARSRGARVREAKTRGVRARRRGGARRAAR